MEAYLPTLGSTTAFTSPTKRALFVSVLFVLHGAVSATRAFFLFGDTSVWIMDEDNHTHFVNEAFLMNE
ncbi:hypothetical protein CYMTET_35636 [Cymbomonas tetramitiformis]|uniref:Uncharacterized protein n=1 Tax=Cymbomonas tetramitiformis TaxID=36881 RepID=A0AAE0F8T9_9CHLO|nr:hypothetical protein CYMTET_35636 [Cymbomonas tetramitiformis]